MSNPTTALIHPWAERHIPDQSGKTFVVTGANSGIGYATTAALASKQAKVIMACRNRAKAEQARAEIASAVPKAQLDIVDLDLADLASVNACAHTLEQTYPRIDALINNAGLGWIKRTETADGYEMQLGANHLGHFALTCKLIPLLKQAPDARVISTASLAHYWGRIHFEDLQLKQSYSRVKAYGQSKLANLLFGLELQGYFERNQLPIKSIIVHPGMAGTNIANSALEAGNHQAMAKIAEALTPFVTQSPQMGCLCTLYAATSPDAQGGRYYGPKYAFEMFGTPKPARIAKHARDPAIAKRLWDVSEQLTGVHYPETSESHPQPAMN